MTLGALSVTALSVWLAVVGLLVLLISVGCEARMIKGNTNIITGRVTRLAKFSFRPEGTSVIKGQIVYRGAEHRGALYLFMDTEWEQYHAESDECQRMSKATATINIGTKIFSGKGWMTKQEMHEISTGTFQFDFEWNIEHRVRTYGYYLVVGDCQPSTTGRRFRQIDYEVNFLNSGNDHMPAEEQGLMTLHILCALLLGAFAASMIWGNKKTTASMSNAAQHYFGGGSNEGPPPAATTLIIFAYSCEFASVVFELMHYWKYIYDGTGLFILDFVSEVLEGISQTSLAYLLLAFASGWTLVEGTITAKSDHAINPEALGEDHPATITLSFMNIVTFVLQLLNKLLQFDEFSKFHDHDSWPGFFLTLIRLAVAIFFTVQVYSTLSQMRKKRLAKGHTQRFMMSLAIFGGLWFWVFPLLVAISGIFAHYLRHRLVNGGVKIMQTLCLVVLTKQIFDETSVYTKASLNRGGVLLGGSA